MQSDQEAAIMFVATNKIGMGGCCEAQHRAIRSNSAYNSPKGKSR
jgi:hypothetical protein